MTMSAPISRTAKNRTPIEMLIQIGERTHSHDQVMTPQSFKTMKATARRPTNPIPDDEDDDDELLMVVTRGVVVEVLRGVWGRSYKVTRDLW